MTRRISTVLGVLAALLAASAAALAISPRTVDRHRSNMVEKLGLNGTHALTRFAVAQSSAL